MDTCVVVVAAAAIITVLVVVVLVVDVVVIVVFVVVAMSFRSLDQIDLRSEIRSDQDQSRSLLSIMEIRSEMSDLRSCKKGQDLCQDRSGSKFRSDQNTFDSRSEDQTNIVDLNSYNVQP